eukprot:GFUD01000107.1.p1 GENE.GFUD01000107.1~~GFUD01000107.1.p1  ORF type:complete len:595 (+),score=129.91 GFUD01000107.1:61-1845(+)
MMALDISFDKVGVEATNKKQKSSNDNKEKIISQLRQSLFPNVPPFINFQAPNQKYDNFIPLDIPWNLWTVISNPLLIQCMTRAGFRMKMVSEVSYSNLTGAIWDVVDSKTRVLRFLKITKSPTEAFRLLAGVANSKDLLKMNKEVKINRLPGFTSICRKDELARNYKIFRNKFGEIEFNFVPETYVLPENRSKLLQCMTRAQIPKAPDTSMREIHGMNKTNVWIVKPANQARGEGIYLIDNIFDLPSDDENRKDVTYAIAQKYISNSFLIKGHKFDMRLYVLVTSVDPLMVYIYGDGLARFASEPYSTDSLDIRNNCIHLTNTSINRENKDSYLDGDQDDAFSGFLWTLSMLKEYLTMAGVDWNNIWSQIQDIVRKTIILGYSSMRVEGEEVTSSYNCYKLLGLDIMLDSDLKPWVLEVNTDPSLCADPVDTNLKANMIAEMFNIVGFHIPQEIAKKNKSDIISQYPEFAELSYDMKVYEKPAKKAVNLTDEEMSEYLESDHIEASDIHLLMKAEEELSQTKEFTRLIPNNSTSRYLQFLGKDIHADRLLDMWEKVKQRKDNCLENLKHSFARNMHCDRDNQMDNNDISNVSIL